MKERNRLRKERNILLSKVMSNIFLKVTIKTFVLKKKAKAQGSFLQTCVWDFPFSIPFCFCSFRFHYLSIFLFNKMHGLFDFKTP